MGRWGIVSSAVDEAVAASRRLHPEAWEKVDRIARTIDPGAFAKWYDTTGPDAEPVEPRLRVRMKRARARRKAWDILRELGIVPETTDWEAIFEEMDRTPQPQEVEDEA